MKKVFFTALTAVTIISSAFAAPVKDVNNLVKRSFENSFGNVSDLQWKVTSDYTKATFVLDNVKTEAFYSSDGELIGTSHAISIENLPTFAKRNFAKKYDGYTVKEAIEFDGVETTSYYISAKKDNSEVVLKVSDGTMDVYKVPYKK